MRLGWLSKLLSIGVLASTLSTSCVNLNRENSDILKTQSTAKDNQLVLSKDEYIKQTAIQEILNQVYQEDVDSKNTYIQEQLDTKSNEIFEEFQNTLAYYNLSVVRIYSNPFADTPEDFITGRRKFIKLINDNWLFFLYNYHKLQFLGSSPALINSSDEFNRKYSAKLKWILQADSNKIKDYATNEIPALETEYGSFSKVPPPEKDDKGIYKYQNWPYYRVLFYLRMNNDTIVSLSVNHLKDFKGVYLNSRITTPEFIQTKKIKDFSIAEYAKNFYKVDSNLDAISTKYKSSSSFYEAQNGDAVPYNLNFIVK
ncbi:aromatic motif membrane protein [Mycoplasma bradburyae]|uniref:Lipoprotein n=1 Tax=Mycoplasma bradburyae TaxID=2963128 RepID=A0AAW6HQ44_9MOLU|nr:aromatic motif membrane protein [Mycoplasma bradburyae]MDC4163068.1 hypothetical protein [Mycoplasma bradburyae]MDC4181659.1 hypothetical protein [Mycoplasma bradburyae]MDC4183113.1 hypothetical protein [Mycoplasma bradburyae]MDC4183836.1 hypothetical protein [Mycoplasma bradburyae]UTS69919.1 hypothetical protein NMG68_02745 [Mycoplasma bradburyae]